MDTKAYIESGILEQFVLGNTTPDETTEIIEFSKSHPEIKEEINAIEEGLMNYAESFNSEPPIALKDKVLAHFELHEIKVAKSTINANALNIDTNNGHSRRFEIYRFFAAASIVLLGISIVGNIWLFNSLKRSQNQVASLSSQNTFLTDNTKTQEAKYSSLEENIKILINPNVRSVKLNGLPLMPQARATVYWDTDKKEVYLTAVSLAANLENEQYQLWAIVNGKPVDAGVFDTKDALKSIAKMKNIADASAFAITIEKKGGAISPTLDKMVLMGAVI